MKLLDKFLAFSLLLLFGVGAFAADCYVAPYGDDSNPGTKSKPFKTIQRGVEKLSAGDTLYIRGGSYHEAVVVNNLSGTGKKPVTITNYQGEEVTIDGTVPITGPWVRHHGKIYKTRAPQDVWQLFVDGRMQVIARWPNATNPIDPLQYNPDGWEAKDGTWWSKESTWASADAPGTVPYDKIECNPTHYGYDLAALNKSFEDGSIIFLFRKGPIYERRITSHDAGSNFLTHSPIYRDRKDQDYFKEGFKESKRFFLEHLNALDRTEEWFYTPADKTIYLWADDGLDPAGLDVRGRTMTRLLTMAGGSHVTIKGLKFFAGNFSLAGDDITLEDCVFSYPDASQRLLDNYIKGDVLPCYATIVDGHNFSMINCVYEYSELGIRINGEHGTLHNNLLHHVNMLGMFGVSVVRDVETFTRNTIRVTTARAPLGGFQKLVSGNLIEAFGLFQRLDGAAMQTNMANQAGSVFSYNWLFKSFKGGLRNQDANGQFGGEDTTFHHQVSYKIGTLCSVRGDYNKTYNNTSLEGKGTKRGLPRNDIEVRAVGTPSGITGFNAHSETRNNLANRIGGKETERIPLPGKHSHNWSGYDTGTRARDQLRDPDNFDFRPKLGSDLIDAGYVIPGVTDDYLGSAPDIGAYEYGDPNYWIPGCKFKKASCPIPPYAATNVKLDADLMWLGGYKAVSHDVYFGTSESAVANATRQSSEYKSSQTNNIFDPCTLNNDTWYYWRIDALDANGNVKTHGDTWSFTTGSAVSGDLQVISIDH